MKNSVVFGILFLVSFSFSFAQDMEVIKGKMLVKPWTKSLDSYCAGGSEYYVLKINRKTEVTLDLSEMEEKEGLNRYLSSKKVFVYGHKETFIKEETDPMSQHPTNPPSCTVFKVKNINLRH